MLNLRKFTPSDLNRVLEITESSFSEPWKKNSFEIIYKKHPNEFFVAEDNEEITGFIAGGIINEAGGIKIIAVNKNHRQKGIGKALVKKILDHFQNNGVKEVIARARTNNKTSISFLKSLGFEVKKTVEKYYKNGDDAYLMKKSI
ncbi:MAG: ribosomal protein S18-alanine N-acetyltransferase [Candidatus Nealsonbacteria bacterium]